MRILIWLVFLSSCTAAKNSLSKQLTLQSFKDRALCDCLATGYDSAGTNSLGQRLKGYDPVAVVLFDPAIFANLKIVMKHIELDSINRIGHVAKSAEGQRVFKSCMEYYRSEDLDTLAHRMIKKWRLQKNLEEYISSKYPTW